ARGSVRRQVQRERGAPSQLALYLNVASVRPRDLARDGQAQTQPALLVRVHASPGRIELVEHPVEIPRPDADSAVRDRDRDASLRGCDADPDLLLLAAVLNRI